MKILVVTLHHVTNFGSMLQSYATQAYLESLGHTVEFADFVPEGLTFTRALFPRNNNRSFLGKCIRFFPVLVCNLLQYRIVNRFIRKYIHVTPKRYRRYQDLLEDVPQADVYMTGSDQIWNTQNSNPPEDLKAYYLCFAPKGKRKVAYAGSFGKTEFTPEEQSRIAGYLKEYDYLSVREDTALQTLQQLGIQTGVHVLDPSFLLDAKQWSQWIAQEPVPKKGYVFVYNLNRNQKIKQCALRIAQQKGLRIVNFADTFEMIKGAQNRLSNTARDFVRYLSHADYVVTDSFHGTAFSINFSRQFICFPAPKYNSRLESILRVTGLSERLIEEWQEDIVFKEIDYQEVGSDRKSVV